MDGIDTTKHTSSHIKRIVEELSKTIVELKKEENFEFDPVISKLERVLHLWKSDQE